MDPETNNALRSGVPSNFQTTHWSAVLAASRLESPEGDKALATLCELYWYPLYAFIRRRGYSPEDSEDLTQEFFARLIEGNSVRTAEREKGRFRSFLLGSLKHFLSNEHQKKQTLKRGGACTIVSLDAVLAEGRYGAEPSDQVSPELLFERRWALLLLERTLGLLKEEYLQAGKEAHFEALEGFLSGSKNASASYKETAARLQMSQDAVRQAACRLRSRFGQLLRWQVAQTVSGPAEVEEELAYLLMTFSK